MTDRKPALLAAAGEFPALHASSFAAAAVVGSLIVAVCAQVAVPLPWTPVPMTLQPFGVLLVGLLFGPGLGAAAMAAYLLEGAAGLPVFAPGFGGLLPLGPSAGYLLSYPLAAAAAGIGAKAGFGRKLLAAAAGDLVILLSGTEWLAALGGGWAQAFHLGVAPFLAGDAIQLSLAAGAASGGIYLVRRRTGR